MAGKPAEAENPKKGVIKSGEFKGQEVIYKPNGDLLFVGNDSAGGTSGDPGTTYRKRLDGKYGSRRGMLDIGPIEEKKEEKSSGGGGGSEQQAQPQGLLASYNPDNVIYNQGGLLGQGLNTDQIVGGLLPGQEEWIYQVNPNHQVAQDLGVYTLPDFRIV